MKNPMIYYLLFFCLCSPFLLWGQTGTIKGNVKDNNEHLLIGATVFLEGTIQGAYTDLDGNYEITNVNPGIYQLVFEYVGFETIKKEVDVKSGETLTVDIILGEDALKMDEIVVTGVSDQRTKLEASVAITTLDQEVISQRNARGTGELINAVPGTHVDNSSGEVAAVVYARGLASGIRSQPGFHYVSLQEDGLPVLSTQFQFSSVDMYHRADGTVSKFEAIRGGSASIAAANAPGGIFNFVSHEGGNTLGGEFKLQGGIQGDFNPIFRLDGNIGGPINDRGWFSNIGGFYRLDQGPRDLPYNANVGGQMKANIVKRHDNGSFKIYGKFLNDKVTRFEYLPVNNLDDIEPLDGFNLNYSTIYPEVKVDNLPDGERFLDDPTATRSFDSNKAIRNENYSIGMNVFQRVGSREEGEDGWLIRNNAKYSYAKQRYSQYAGNIVLDPATAINTFYGLPPIAGLLFNNYTYKDFNTGEVLFNQADSIQEFDKLWIAAGFTIENKINDVMNQLVVTKEIRKHKFTFGSFLSFADVDIAWTGDAVGSTLEANPRVVEITHPAIFTLFDPTVSTYYYTNPNNGLLSEGAAAYNRASAKSTTVSWFASDSWEVSEKLNVEAGVRFESLFHNGTNEKFEFARALFGDTTFTAFQPDPFPFGTDNNYATFSDAGTRIGTGEFVDYKHNYHYWSASAGVNYKFNKGLAVYGRFTKGNKGPELGYYVSNFVNGPAQKGFIEKIYMAETGVKLRTMFGSIFLTGFYSQMNDVAFQLLVPGQQGIVVFTPSTFNKIRTIGSELEAVIMPFKNFVAKAILTAQSPKFVEFNYYNLNGSAVPVFIGDTYPEDPNNPGCSLYDDANGACIPAGTPSDDYIENFDGNQLSDVPQIISDFTAMYKISRFNLYANWRYTGKRMANRRNTLEIPGFHMFNAGLDGKITKNISASLKVNNIFNSAGIMGFDGIGNLGNTPEDLTEDAIEANASSESPNPYFVRPILPRIVTASLSYKF